MKRMIFTTIIAAIVLSIATGSTVPALAQDFEKGCKNDGDIIQKKITEFDSLTEATNGHRSQENIKKLKDILFEIEKFSVDLYGRWQVTTAMGPEHKYDYMVCMTEVKYIMPMVVNAKLNISKVYIDSGLKEDAKAMLRSIITDYTGDAFRGQTKKAEFMLEDLRGIK